MEYKLVNIERVRTIYEKYITVFPDNPDPFIQWAEMEKSLNEIDRYRAIFELAISHPTMSMPEKVWKSYIDNEIELEEYENVRRLFEELLSRSKNVKVKGNGNMRDREGKQLCLRRFWLTFFF